ncbi:hypothetical protein PGT21_024973 [Puccinia graminis f. sp. tritici]|uniref:Uncharacterized protein n=1 Tax=Puccinia graminis f. sp. tritici TaxID=56615 RepID=A0A5B0NM64_PUCGR|nr:hypothetical protein PGT21_024973 [Puccinia graminis f. sp. tritici]
MEIMCTSLMNVNTTEDQRDHFAVDVTAGQFLCFPGISVLQGSVISYEAVACPSEPHPSICLAVDEECAVVVMGRKHRRAQAAKIAIAVMASTAALV